MNGLLRNGFLEVYAVIYMRVLNMCVLGNFALPIVYHDTKNS